MTNIPHPQAAPDRAGVTAAGGVLGLQGWGWGWGDGLPITHRIVGVVGADAAMRERVAGWLGRPRWLLNATR